MESSNLMVSRKSAQTVEDRPRQIPWFEGLLAVSVLALVLQMFPGMVWTLMAVCTAIWHATIAVVDVRSWSWKAYSGFFFVVIAFLLVVRARSES